MQKRRALSLQDYIDFLRRSWWKSYRETRRTNLVGNYLEGLSASTTLSTERDQGRR
jgi:hypothetical protein